MQQETPTTRNADVIYGCASSLKNNLRNSESVLHFKIELCLILHPSQRKTPYSSMLIIDALLSFMCPKMLRWTQWIRYKSNVGVVCTSCYFVTCEFKWYNRTVQEQSEWWAERWAVSSCSAAFFLLRSLCLYMKGTLFVHQCTWDAIGHFTQGNLGVCRELAVSPLLCRSSWTFDCTQFQFTNKTISRWDYQLHSFSLWCRSPIQDLLYLLSSINTEYIVIFRQMIHIRDSYLPVLYHDESECADTETNAFHFLSPVPQTVPGCLTSTVPGPQYITTAIIIVPQVILITFLRQCYGSDSHNFTMRVSADAAANPVKWF